MPTVIVSVSALIGNGTAALKQLIEQFSWQACPRLAIRGCDEVFVSQMADFTAGDVAVEHLLDKQLNRSQRIERALSPGVAQVMAGLFDPLFVELVIADHP